MHTAVAKIFVARMLTAPCGLRGCKNRPAPFHGWMSYKATKPGCPSIISYSMLYYYPRRARSALGVDTVLTLDVCMFVCMLGL